MNNYNNTNRNNNGRNNNNRRGQNNNFNKKVTRQPRVNPNEIKAPLYLPADLNENIVNEITTVLTETKFNKISIPLGTYRCIIDSNVDADDARVCTIGYIRKYDAETKEFTLTLFNKFTDLIKSQGDVVVELQFTTFKEALGSITKFNIVPVVYEEVTEEVDESVELVEE